MFNWQKPASFTSLGTEEAVKYALNIIDMLFFDVTASFEVITEHCRAFAPPITPSCLLRSDKSFICGDCPCRPCGIWAGPPTAPPRISRRIWPKMSPPGRGTSGPEGVGPCCPPGRVNGGLGLRRRQPELITERGHRFAVMRIVEDFIQARHNSYSLSPALGWGLYLFYIRSVGRARRSSGLRRSR